MPNTDISITSSPACSIACPSCGHVQEEIKIHRAVELLAICEGCESPFGLEISATGSY